MSVGVHRCDCAACACVRVRGCVRPPLHPLLCHTRQTSNLTKDKSRAAISRVPSGTPTVLPEVRSWPRPWGALGRTEEGRGILLAGPLHTLPPILFTERLGRVREPPPGYSQRVGRAKRACGL